MFRIPEAALKYEKCIRILEDEQQDPNAEQQQQQDPNAEQQQQQQEQQQDPNAQQQQEQPMEDGQEQQGTQQSGIESAQTAEDAYKAGLIEIENQIATTGRKRYQRYRMNGGKDGWEVFKKNLQDSLKQELEEDIEEMYGYNPANTSEKDILVMIKNGIDNINQALQMQTGLQQQQMQLAQQAMQEGYDYLSDRYYNNYMRRNNRYY